MDEAEESVLVVFVILKTVRLPFSVAAMIGAAFADGIEIPDEDAEKLKTMKLVREYIQAKI